MRLRILGIDRDRPVERALGPVEVSLRVVDQADLKHGTGMIGAKLGSTAIGRGGAIQIALPAQCVTEVEMRFRFGRIDPDRAAICGDRPVDMTGYLERVAKIVVCARIAFVERDGAPQQRDRPSGLVELEGDHGAGLQGILVIGACGENLAIERLRIGEPPGSPIEGGPAQCFTDAGRRHRRTTAAVAGALARRSRCVSGPRTLPSRTSALIRRHVAFRPSPPPLREHDVK